MRFIFCSGLLAVLLALTGCSSPTCDARGPSDVCEIHHEFMHEEIITKLKPAPPPTVEYLQARAKGFMHARPFLLPEGCDRCAVNICDDCVQAEREWKQQHPGQ